MWGVDEQRLVWTAPGTAAHLMDLPRDVRARLEVAEIPADPLRHPRLPEVRALVPPLVRNQGDDDYDLKKLMAPGNRPIDIVRSGTVVTDLLA